MNIITDQKLCWPHNLKKSMVIMWRFTRTTGTQTIISSHSSPKPWCSQDQQSRMEAPLKEPWDHPKDSLVQFIQAIKEVLFRMNRSWWVGADLSHQESSLLELTFLTNLQRTREAATSLQRGPSSYRQGVVTEAQRVQEGRLLTLQTTDSSRESKISRAGIFSERP